MDHLKLFKEEIVYAKSLDQANKIFLNLIQKLGIECASYTCVSSQYPHKYLLEPEFININYPEEWKKIYVEKDYINEDPLFIHVKKIRSSATWEETLKGRILTATQKRISDSRVNDYKLYDGVTIPFFTGKIVSIMTLASTN